MRDLSLDLCSLREAYAAGLSPVEVVELVYARLAAAGDPGIFLSTAPIESARAAARALGAFDARRPLWGVPFAVKDNIDAAGLPTTAACPAFAYRPDEHAFVVARLLDAGAILIGKTNLDQFATGLVGVRTPYPVPRNAFDPAIVPGGSSSGSAVAVARDIVSFALGTDTAGSGRIPAALNNLVGLKPSVGALSTRGVVPACKTLDCVSILALTVDDAWRVYAVMAAPDADDPLQRPLSLSDPGPAPPTLRVGVPRQGDCEFFGDAAAEQAWQAAKTVLAQAGATFVDIDMRPYLEIAGLLYDGPWIAERQAALKDFIAAHPDDMLPVTRGIVESAKRFTAADAFLGLYRLKDVAHLASRMWRTIDMLCAPSLPRIPTLDDLVEDPIGPNTRLGRWTNFVNLLDMCALAIPGPFRSDGRPAGVTLIGPRGADAALASFGRVAHALAATPMGAGARPLRAAKQPIPANDALIELAVVGAHLSGMPLNHELANLGGVFLRAGATEPSYRLHALAGGPPMRPGLIRCASGEGRAIAVEVWGLPPEGFARFVSAIPSPLGVGALLLADGTRPKGFLVEPEGLVGATDISSHGGWRAYLASCA